MESTGEKWTDSAERVIVTADTMRDHYIELGCPEKKITVLPNTINIEAFDHFPVKEDIIEAHKSEFTLVYTGGINLHRGLDFCWRLCRWS